MLHETRSRSLGAMVVNVDVSLAAAIATFSSFLYSTGGISINISQTNATNIATVLMRIALKVFSDNVPVIKKITRSSLSPKPDDSNVISTNEIKSALIDPEENKQTPGIINSNKMKKGKEEEGEDEEQEEEEDQMVHRVVYN